MYDPMQQSAKAFEVRGSWKRFTRYDLLNSVIVPADGSDLTEYDPWTDYRSNAGKYRTVQQPYVPLLNLYERLKECESRGIRPFRLASRFFRGGPVRGPQNEADELIVGWCNEHGLLGLIPVLSNSIFQAAAIRPAKSESSRFVVKRQHFRDGGAWMTRSSKETVHGSDPDCADEGGRLSADEWPKPSVTWFNWLSHAYEERPLEFIRDYFLPTPFGSRREENFRPPCPNSTGFWTRYGEPVAEFVRWSRIFAEAVQFASYESAGSDEETSRSVNESYWALNGLAQSASPAFHFNSRRNVVSEERVSAGLLASYALMFLWDRAEGRRALKCETCTARFVSDEQRARYCSPRCRNTAQSRRYRARKAVANV